MLNVPELVGVVLDEFWRGRVAIDRDQSEVSLFCWAQGSIPNGAICRLDVLNNRTCAVSCQIRGSFDSLRPGENVLLEGSARARAGRAANHNDGKIRSPYLVPVFNAATIDAFNLGGREIRYSRNLAVYANGKDDHRNLVINQLALNFRGKDIRVADLHGA